MNIIEKELSGHDRFDFPGHVSCVTAGTGGESYFICGSEKCAIYDCGMAYCHEDLIKNIEEKLSDSCMEKLDFVFMSHTHYDHIGALPYIIERWPDVLVCGAEKAAKVFASEGAKRTMKRLGTVARDKFSGKDEEISVEGLRLDIIMKDGDSVNLGDCEVKAVETKGHTDCSMSYIVEPDSTLLASESTGILRYPGGVDTAILKSYSDTIESAKKCKALGVKHIVTNHFGMIPDGLVKDYFDFYIESAEGEKKFILDLHNEGLCEQDIIYAYRDKHWTEERGKSQPEEAFLENAKYIVEHIINTFGETN